MPIFRTNISVHLSRLLNQAGFALERPRNTLKSFFPIQTDPFCRFFTNIKLWKHGALTFSFFLKSSIKSSPVIQFLENELSSAICGVILRKQV